MIWSIALAVTFPSRFATPTRADSKRKLGVMEDLGDGVLAEHEVATGR